MSLKTALCLNYFFIIYQNIDGTFCLIRASFTQLFLIHTFVRSAENLKQVPLVFIVMSGKAKVDYGAIFRTVLYQLPTVPAVDNITADTALG